VWEKFKFQPPASTVAAAECGRALSWSKRPLDSKLPLLLRIAGLSFDFSISDVLTPSDDKKRITAGGSLAMLPF
jgi:hypothetical protein